MSVIRHRKLLTLTAVLALAALVSVAAIGGMVLGGGPPPDSGSSSAPGDQGTQQAAGGSYTGQVPCPDSGGGEVGSGASPGTGGGSASPGGGGAVEPGPPTGQQPCPPDGVKGPIRAGLAPMDREAFRTPLKPIAGVEDKEPVTLESFFDVYARLDIQKRFDLVATELVALELSAPSDGALFQTREIRLAADSKKVVVKVLDIPFTSSDREKMGRVIIAVPDDGGPPLVWGQAKERQETGMGDIKTMLRLVQALERSDGTIVVATYKTGWYGCCPHDNWWYGVYWWWWYYYWWYDYDWGWWYDWWWVYYHWWYWYGWSWAW